jgi:hypothetical protein
MPEKKLFEKYLTKFHDILKKSGNFDKAADSFVSLLIPVEEKSANSSMKTINKGKVDPKWGFIKTAWDILKTPENPDYLPIKLQPLISMKAYLQEPHFTLPAMQLTPGQFLSYACNRMNCRGAGFLLIMMLFIISGIALNPFVTTS